MRKDAHRIAAFTAKEKYYVPENPCQRGHKLRATSSGECIECKRLTEKVRYAQDPEKFKLKSRQYTLNNKEKVSARNKKAWANRTEEERSAINTYRRQYYKNTIEARLEEKRAYYLRLKSDANRFKLRRAKATARRQLIGRKPEPSNPDVKRKYKLSAKGRLANSRYELGKLQRTPKWLSEDDLWMMEEVYALAVLRTALHGFSWHVDHILPLQGELVSGLHVPTNLQVIPWLDNLKKTNKYLPA